jgi:hypothetical protein
MRPGSSCADPVSTALTGWARSSWLSWDMSCLGQCGIFTRHSTDPDQAIGLCPFDVMMTAR